MRRPPIACRRAVQSFQYSASPHVWISDDLLSSTLNQFFRISHQDQRRYGSHVPGPLEARRRAAKRKMSVSAGIFPQDDFPPPFSLSALFGFAKASQPTWRYEPPSLPQNLGSSYPSSGFIVQKPPFVQELTFLYSTRLDAPRHPTEPSSLH